MVAPNSLLMESYAKTAAGADILRVENGRPSVLVEAALGDTIVALAAIDMMMVVRMAFECPLAILAVVVVVAGESCCSSFV